MKRIYAISVTLATLVFMNLIGGPHRIKMNGAEIVREGTETVYTLTVENISDRDFEDLVIRIDGFSPSGLEYCLSWSDDLKIYEYVFDDSASIEAFVECVPMGETVALQIRAKGTFLKEVGDIHSLTLTIDVNPGNHRKGTIRKKVSIYKCD